MGFLENKFKLKSYQVRAFEFIKKNKKVLLALPTGSGKTLSSTYSIVKSLPANFRVLFFTETVAIDDIIESMCTFFSKDTYKPVSTIGCNFSIREEFYEQFVSGNINAIVTTYAILRNDKDYLLALLRYFKAQGIPVAIVLDEATQVKNEESINHKVSKSLGALCDLMIALTATPISSKLNDIDNIIRCLNTKNYISKDKFKNSFEINTFETEGFLFKMKGEAGNSLCLNSEYSALPGKVIKKGKPYFKIPWKLEKHLKPKKVTIHTKRPVNIDILDGEGLSLPALNNREGDFIGDITPSIIYNKEKNVFSIYTPIVKCIRDNTVRFRSVGFTITYYDAKAKKTIEMKHLYTFSYERVVS